MLSAEQVAEFQANGFVNGGLALTAAEVDELCDELDKVIAEQTATPPLSLRNLSRQTDQPVWQVVNIWEASEPFRRLIFHTNVATGAQQLIGTSSIRLWHDQIQYKPPRHGGVNHWHQDGPLWPVLGDDRMVTAWIPLDDVDASNGCMSMVPGSHKWGPRQREYLATVSDFNAIGQGFEAPDGSEVVPVLWPVKRGEVSYHHCLTWHGSHSNTSDRPRRAIAIHYMPDPCPFVAAGEHLLKPHIRAADGEPLRGERFLHVYEDGELLLA